MSEDRPSLEEMFTETFEDRNLTRGEKRALGEVLDELSPDNAELARLRSRVFDMARDALADPEAKAVIGWLEEINKTLLPDAGESGSSDGIAKFSPGDDCAGQIIQLISGSARSIDACVFTITDNRVSDALIDAHKRGVKVRIITDDEKVMDRGSDIQRLEDAGLPVRVDRTANHMHHKFAIFDASLLLTGSYNWTRSAANHNEENIVVTGDRRLKKAFEGEFARLWKAFGAPY